MVVCYLNNLVRDLKKSITLPYYTSLRKNFRAIKSNIFADIYWHFSRSNYHTFGVNVKIIYNINGKVQKI